ncbi:MAG TPA: hypothetical protein VGM72_10930 [Micropepsaceae bacterium]
MAISGILPRSPMPIPCRAALKKMSVKSDSYKSNIGDQAGFGQNMPGASAMPGKKLSF